MAEPPGALEVPKGPPKGGDKADPQILLDGIWDRKANGRLDRFSLLSDEKRPNADTYAKTQKYVNEYPDAAAGIIVMSKMPFAERNGVKDALVLYDDGLWNLECSSKPSTAKIPLMTRIDTRACHSGPKEYTPPPPKPYTVDDLVPPRPTKEIADAVGRMAVNLGNQCLSPADEVAFKKAIDDINKRSGLSDANRCEILSNLCVMLWTGKDRAFGDSTCRKLALATAQAVAHPPEGATGDLKLAKSDPQQFVQYVRNMAVKGVAGDKQVTEAGKKEVSEAKNPQESLDKLLGATRAVVPNEITIDLRKLDDANAANFSISDDVKKILREVHDADGRIHTIKISHQNNGDDVIAIGLEGARTEGSGVRKMTFADTLRMTVHRNADGSIELINMKGLGSAFGDVTDLKLGKMDDPNRKITAIISPSDYLPSVSKDVTDNVPQQTKDLFQKMIIALDAVNKERKR